MKKLEDYVVSIPDFPQEGIIFRDVTSVLENADGLHLAIDGLEEKIGDREFDVIVGPESRGFIFGMPIAYNHHKAFVPVRKKGQSPEVLFSEPLLLTSYTNHLFCAGRRENFHVRRYLLPMSWSTAPRKSRFTSAPSSREIK